VTSENISFAHRIINLWNSLLAPVVHASSVNDFKNKLDAHWTNQEMVHNYRVETNFRNRKQEYFTISCISFTVSVYVFYRASYASTLLAVIACLSICPSVRLSVRHNLELYKDGKPRITLITPYDSPETPVFPC